jgi:hypothetical protein
VCSACRWFGVADIGAAVDLLPAVREQLCRAREHARVDVAQRDDAHVREAVQSVDVRLTALVEADDGDA